MEERGGTSYSTCRIQGAIEMKSVSERSIQTDISQFSVNLALRAFLALAEKMPYEKRVGMGGDFMRRLVAPVAGLRRRIHSNLGLIYPDMDARERNRICEQCLVNFGRLFVENFNTKEFVERVSSADLFGPGVSHLERARATGRPVLLITGHFGNYEAPRAALVKRGFKVGGIYREMNNRFFNRLYVKKLEHIGEPVYPTDKKGTRAFIKFVRSGGFAIMLNDQYSSRGELLNFMGRPTRTMLSAARIAINYDALLVPFYGIRKNNGLDFEARFETPIPHGHPRDMTQALNDNLESMVRKFPDQWFWPHRRWKE